jgi:hypothetical protein
MKTINNKASSQKRGSALPLIVCVLVILLFLGNGLMNISLQARIFAIRTGDQIAARCAADAGLTKAVFEMNQMKENSPWNDSVLPQATDAVLPNCDATFSYAVTGDLDGGYSVESIGMSGMAIRKVYAALRVKGLFDFGILVKETVTLHSGVLVDGYNSSDASQADVLVQVATVSNNPDDIAVMPGATVDGEVLFGVDSDFPEVDPPALTVTDTDIYTKGKTITIGPADSGQYSNINLQQQGDANTGIAKPGILEIAGGDVVLHVTGDIWLGHICEITIKPDSSLTLYLDGDLVMGNSSSFNNETKIPSNLALYGTGEGQKLEIKAKSDWYGVVYAPNADIYLKAKGDVYGAFVGTSLDNKSGGFVWYDAALRDVDLDGIGSRFAVRRWWEE